MEEIAREAKLKNQEQSLKGADYALTGDVVEFGRKEVRGTSSYSAFWAAANSRWRIPR